LELQDSTHILQEVHPASQHLLLTLDSISRVSASEALGITKEANPETVLGLVI
jgi:hypothetical protein